MLLMRQAWRIEGKRGKQQSANSECASNKVPTKVLITKVPKAKQCANNSKVLATTVPTTKTPTSLLKTEAAGMPHEVMIVTELKTSQNSRGNEHETTTATAWTWTTKTAQTNMWIQRCNYGKH